MGRRRSRLMTETLKIIRRFPKISSKELGRILGEKGIRVSPAYSRKLKQRAMEILSRSGNCVTPNCVTVPEANAQTSKFEEKKPETVSVPDNTFTQPGPRDIESVTELTTGGSPRFGVHGGKFGVVLDGGFYWWVRRLWDVKGQVSFQKMRGFDEPWIAGCYHGVSFTVLPPCEAYDGRSLLIWSIPRPGSVAAYREGFLRIQGFAGEYGYEFGERDVWLVQRMHYAEPGDRFGFGEPVKLCFADGGFVMFDRSRGFPETEYDSIDTFLKLVEYRVSADRVEDLAEHVEALSRRLKTLESTVSRPSANSAARNVADKPAYQSFLPSRWRERTSPDFNPGRGYHDCPHGRERLEPDCQWRFCRFNCRLWRGW